MWQQIMIYFQDNSQSYRQMLMQHIVVSMTALLIATFVGVSIGFLCVKYKRSQKWIVTFFSILRIVPSLAVLLLLLPILGTGAPSAIVALVLLAVPPILMNTVAGLEDVPEFMIETALACGMTDVQVWRKVRFPLAMPLILTGIRTALIEVIASATLAAKIGAGGLGEIIFTGLGLNRFDLLLVGGISVALLSICAGLLFEVLNKMTLHYQQL